MLDLSSTLREIKANIGQLFQSGYKVFSVWYAGSFGAQAERNEDLAVRSRIPGHILEFQVCVALSIYGFQFRKTCRVLKL
jgi:hypothetical protein